MGSSSERERFIDFSVPYLQVNGSILTRKDGLEIGSLKDLTGKRVLVQPGSLGERYLQSHGLAESIVCVNTMKEAVEQLSAGGADAALGSRLTMLSIARWMKLNELETAGPPLDDFEIRLCFGVRPGHKALLANLNEGLALIHDSGEYAQIYEQWFAKVDPRGFSRQDMAILIIVALASILTVLGVAWVRGRVLARRIKASEALYRSIFDVSPDGVLVFCPDLQSGSGWILQQANRTAERLFWDEASAPLGDSAEDCFRRDAGLAASVAEALDGQTISVKDLTVPLKRACAGCA